MRAIASCLPLLFLGLLSCARKLPGPDECRAFALTSLGVEPGMPASVLRQNPRLAARAEEVTRKCLTTPWDYQLLSCVQNGGSAQLCLARFERRRLMAAE